ncbi:NACHT domain-containing NTPase [Nonomuraea sp. MTCD27]|uniref:NACHT domain-containing protein n=1 Tax=Nonomuraea sp. MTCD27 TaxID=1676747 RepID=UPI0035BFF35C
MGASLTVAAGIAINQILADGTLSWSWGYLALVFTVLGALIQAGATPVASGDGTRVRRGRGSQRDYLRRVQASVDQMETIGLLTQAEFVLQARQVYVDVMLQPRTVADAVTDSGIGPTTPADGAAATARRASLESFLVKGRALAVLGAAGSGKTTLARYTALELTERRWPWQREFWRRRRIPVLLYLRDHAEAVTDGRPRDLAQVAVRARWLDGVIPAEWLERYLSRGRCVVLLDGLDEVVDAGDRGRVTQWVEAQIGRYPGNSFVITSRPLGYDTNRLARADVLAVQRLTSDQIQGFLHDWYRSIEQRARQGDPHEIDRVAVQAADDLLRRIRGLPALYDLAANPLLLTMIANVHRYRGSLPSSRAALYEEMCQVLLHRRQEAKNLTDELASLDGDKKERIVQELALHMMRRKLRDISIEDAQRAIRPVLERTAPTLTPAAFLTHARRSGLLLERRHKRYGFVHQTLQEYLAAALISDHRSRRKLLSDNVSDPWWRETTLLWAARADASRVVQACLAARTVPALHLAYACAAEARELDPTLRAQLDQLLTITPTDPEQIRLLDGVAAARALQDTHVLDDGTRICAHPVTADLWNRYAARISTRSAGSTTGPAVGPWTADITDFLTWLHTLFTDGTNYRLPTTDEARQAISSELYSPTISLWAKDTGTDDYPRLISPAVDLHPHRPTPQQISAYPDLILDHTHLFLRLLFPRSALTFTQLVAYSRSRELTRPQRQLLHKLDIEIALALARDPPLSAVRALAQDFYRASGLDFTHNFDRTRARTLARDRTSTLALAFTRDRALALDLNLDLDPALARALDRDLDLDLDRSLDRDLGLDLAFARAAAASDLGFLDVGTVVVLGRACLQLIRSRTTHAAATGARMRRRKAGGASLTEFLRNELGAVSTWSPADDPAAALKDALSVATRIGAAETRALVENALHLASPLWDRSRPIRQSDMVLAATLVLAALTKSAQTAPDSRLPRSLRGVLSTLIALTPNADLTDTTVRDKLLVLVRT